LAKTKYLEVMNSLHAGEFFGLTKTNIEIGSLILTDTEYTHSYVDWHYHENAYFTFILSGNVIEGNQKEVYHCSAGSLLFHHWQEPHFNIKPNGFTRGFHVELRPDWFEAHGLKSNSLQGSINLKDPHLKKMMYNIFKEVKLDHGLTGLTIETLLTQLLDTAFAPTKSLFDRKPLWALRLKELLHDSPCANWTLKSLSQELALHPVHLSRGFAKYFHCNLGDYVRMLKVQAALSMFPYEDRTLTEIAVSCGFADQSHFIRSFKALHHVTPLTFRKFLKEI